jgi:hypothetical protein
VPAYSLHIIITYRSIHKSKGSRSGIQTEL